MKNLKLLFMTAFMLMFFSCAQKDNPALYKGVGIMAYYFPRGNQVPESLPLNHLSHIYYAFTEVVNNEMQFRRDSSGIKLKMLVAQKRHHPDLKVMISCGGWGGSGGFSDMAKTAENRKIFVESSINFLKEYNLDGLDIDWEYPGMPGIGNPYIPEDRENFTALMRDLRTAMDATGKHLLLTFAAAGWVREFDHIELDKVMQYADYINLMTYDLSGGNDPFTSHHTNLGYISQENLAGTPGDSVMKAEMDTLGPRSSEKIIKFCMDHGVNPKQIVIGSGFYGKGWVGVPPENNGLYQLDKGPYRGHLSYANIRDSIENENGFVRYWDPIAKAPFLYNAQDSIFITYEDTLSVRLKTEYAVKEHLGGIMFWQLLSDTPKDGLLDAIYNEKIKLETQNK